MEKTTLAWIKDTLTNSEYASDKELITYFMAEGPMSREDAEAWVAQREFYSNNIVIHDDDFNDIGIYDAKTRTIKAL